MENSPSVLFDGLVLPDGDEAVTALSGDGHTAEFIVNQYRHCKTILALGASSSLLASSGIDPADGDAGVLLADSSDDAAAARFIDALSKHRHRDREIDPPPV